MRNKILTLLEEVEAKDNVRVLYACESGSRAWGFPSLDSDYDVRFIYLHPPEWYLALNKKRDVIERPLVDNIDLSGWDLRKALGLFYKSNPPLLEWLGSPIVYQENYSIAAQMRELLPTFYSRKACIFHYLHMAKGNYRQYLKSEEVWIKKYFYVLRPLLAVSWLEDDLGVVPMNFSVLVDEIVKSDSLKGEIDSLIRAKRQGEELGCGERIPLIDSFIREEMERIEKQGFIDIAFTHANIDVLDKLFLSALREVWNLDFIKS